MINHFKTTIKLEMLEDCVTRPKDVIMLKDDSYTINSGDIINALTPVLNFSWLSLYIHSNNVNKGWFSSPIRSYESNYFSVLYFHSCLFDDFALHLIESQSTLRELFI